MARRADRVRTEKVPVRLPETDAVPRAWMRNFRLSGVAASVLVLIVAAVVILAPGLGTFFEQRQQIAHLEQQLADAQAAVDELDDELARWSDPAYIEAQARERLFYVYPGDIAYLILGDDVPVTPDGQPISAEIQSTDVDWVATLLGSLVTAGLTDDSPDLLDSPIQSP